MPGLTSFSVTCLRHARHFNWAYSSSKHKYSHEYVFPRTWRIKVDACAAVTEIFDRGQYSTERPASYNPEPTDVIRIPTNIKTYEFKAYKKVGGKYKLVATQSARKCSALLDIPTDMQREAHLRISLTVYFKSGRTVNNTRNFHLMEFLVVSLGDSYASGEGAPDSKAWHTPLYYPKCASRMLSASCPTGDASDKEAVWQERLAHRSYLSGPSLSALALERSSFQTESNETALLAITYLSFASSGATLHHLTTKPQHSWQRVNQIDETLLATQGRAIDALIISIGGNDAGFAQTLLGVTSDKFSLLPDAVLTIALKCLLIGPLGWAGAAAAFFILQDDAGARKEVKDAAMDYINNRCLKSLKDNLAASIESKLRPRHVFLTEYPTGLFEKEDGKVASGCGPFDLPGLKLDRKDALLAKQLGQKLNSKLSSAVDEINRSSSTSSEWHFVTGIDQGFAGHGYCADNPYFVSAEDSCLHQGDFCGAMHPNISGLHIYAGNIFNAVMEYSVKNGPSPQQAVPSIYWKPSVINCGRVLLGEFGRVKKLTITNPSSVDLVVSVSGSRSIFYWSGLSNVTIPPGQSRVITIKFSPIKDMVYKKNLTISTNIPANNKSAARRIAGFETHQIAVTGTGYKISKPSPSIPNSRVQRK